MKKYLIAVLLLPLLATSCMKDLEVVQKSVIDSQNMWKTEGDLTGAMAGAYYRFRAAYKINMSYWGDFRSGVIGQGMGSFSGLALSTNRVTSAEGKGTNWGTLYTCINQCNLILKYADGVTYNNDDTRLEVKANAYFLRAYCYFTIARVWGDAPLMLEGIEGTDANLLPVRSDASLIYQQVEDDVNEARSLMPASVSKRTTANLGAVNMLRTDYYLWKYRTRHGSAQDLAAAKESCEDVLENSTFKLLDNYADVFAIDKKRNEEIIMCIAFVKTTEESTNYMDDYLIPLSKMTDDVSYANNESVKVGSQDQWYSFSQSYQKFLYANPLDTRATTNFTSFTVPESGNTYSWINKFPGEWSDNTRYFTSDIPLYRYSEAILFMAEILNEEGNQPDAIEYLNRIAKRAYKVDNYYPTSLAYDAVSETILNERLKEFAAECKSWWDYIRMGYAFIKIPSLVGRQTETNILLWPISDECFKENSNIRQTVGY
jgi:hypothetical protein